MKDIDHIPTLTDEEKDDLSIQAHDQAKDAVDVLESPDEQDHHSEELFADTFSVGDHVYKWYSFAGIPYMSQHHGIIWEMDENTLTIADFHNMIRRNEEYPKFLVVSRGNLRLTGDESAKKWNKVEYDASLWKRSLWRSGTCTAAKADPPGLVMARVQFLMDIADKLPNFHFLKANCECVAVWCKTGTWATLQASSLLHAAAAGQVKSATTLALFASSQTVAVPSAGIWGWLGYTTKVSLMATQPWILPALAGYGVVTVGGPVWILARAKSFWSTTTTRLNKEFWESAIDRPELFAECITEWSQIET